MTWKEAHEKYKNYQLPNENEVFNHPSEFRGDRLPIEYRVIKYEWECQLDGDFRVSGIVETIHSGRKSEKTIHWIKKMYNKE